MYTKLIFGGLEGDQADSDDSEVPLPVLTGPSKLTVGSCLCPARSWLDMALRKLWLALPLPLSEGRPAAGWLACTTAGFYKGVVVGKKDNKPVKSRWRLSVGPPA